MSLAAFVTDDLRALVQAEIDAAYEGDDYQIRPDSQDVIVDALELVRGLAVERAAELTRCHDADECTAMAIVLNRFAEWTEDWL